MNESAKEFQMSEAEIKAAQKWIEQHLHEYDIVNGCYEQLGEPKADTEMWLNADRNSLRRQESESKEQVEQESECYDECGHPPARGNVVYKTAWPLEPIEKLCGTCLLQIMYDGNPVVGGDALAADPCPWFFGSHDSNGPPWPDCRFWKPRKEHD